MLGTQIGFLGGDWDTKSVTDGSHKIFPKAKDAAGNWGTSSTRTVTVDNAPPPSNVDTTITVGPTATNDTTPTFEFTATISGSTLPAPSMLRPLLRAPRRSR